MVRTNRKLKVAFSLVEVVIAIGICSFALIAILGLFTTGLQSTKESEQEIQAADLASSLISLRLASPTTGPTALPNFAIPAANMTQAYAPVYASTTYVGADGQTTTTLANAKYQITCSAGTNTWSGPAVAQVYLMLSWPPGATPATAAGRYELTTYIPIR